MECSFSKYSAVNRVLNECLFNGKYRAKPLYLTLGVNEKETIAGDLKIDVSLVDNVIANSVSGILEDAGDPYKTLTECLAEWRFNGRKDCPPFTALLYVLAHAGELMHADNEYSSSNYYQRLHEITGVAKGRLSQYGISTFRFWRELERWLKDNDYEYGRPTARQFNSWKYVSLAISQTVVMMADRPLFRTMFDEFGFSSNDLLSEEEMSIYLDSWIKGNKSSKRLKAAWGNKDLRRRVAVAAIEELELWSQGSTSEGETSGASIPRRLSLVATITPSFPEQRFTLSVGVREGDTSGLQGLQWTNKEGEPHKQAYALENTYYGSFATICPDENINIQSVLEAEINLSKSDKASFHRSPKLVIPFKKAPSASYWVEVSRTIFAEEHIVLCKDLPRLRKSVERFLSQAVLPEDYSVLTNKELKGIPEGWVLYLGVTIIKIPEDPSDDVQVLTPLSKNGDLRAVDGLMLENEIWHSRRPPNLRLIGAKSPTSIELFVDDDDFPQQVMSSDTTLCNLTMDKIHIGGSESLTAIAKSDGKQTGEISLLLRSASKPRPLDRGSRNTLYWYSIATAETGQRTGTEKYIHGHQAFNMAEIEIPEPKSFATENSIMISAEDEAFEPPQMKEAAFENGDIAKSCTYRGYHHWICEEFLPGQSKSASKRMHCKDCRSVVLTKNRGKKAKKVLEQRILATPLFKNNKKVQVESKARENLNIELDALNYLGAGKWSSFDRVFGDIFPEAWRIQEIAKVFSSLGYLDVKVDNQTQRIREWSIPPPTLVYKTDGEAFLSGFRNESLLEKVGSAAINYGGKVERTKLQGFPDLITVKNLVASTAKNALSEIHDPHGRKLLVLHDGGGAIAKACLQLSGIGTALSGFHLGSPASPEIFDPVSGRWNLCNDMRSSGAYRFQYAGRSYCYKSVDGRTFLGPYELVKTLAARDRGVFLHHYDKSTMDFYSALGCEPIGLLRRALVSCSGLPPIKSGKVVIYPSVSQSVSDSVLDILYNRERKL